MNKCQEIHTVNETTGKNELQLIHECSYSEPKRFKLGKPLYAYLHMLTPMQWVHDNYESFETTSHHKRNDWKNQLKEMHSLRKQYVEKYKNLRDEYY